MQTIAPYHEYQGTLCVAAPAVLDAGLVADYTWNDWTKNIEDGLMRRGGNGRFSLFAFNKIPYEYRDKIVATFGSPEKKSHVLNNHFSIDAKAQDFFQSYQFETGERLSAEQILAYTLNASMLAAITGLKQERESLWKRLGNHRSGIWQSVAEDADSYHEWLKQAHAGVSHSLPKHWKRLQTKYYEYKREGYALLIDGRAKNNNASKLQTEEQVKLIEELLKKHQNFDNQQIKRLYNAVAKAADWKAISGGTVAKYRKGFNLYVYSGNSGETNFRNNLSMQVKRSAPSHPMLYWTIDGWDAELLYQRPDTNAKGSNITTYHNRPTIVVVLDPCTKYPVGYAVGSHETPQLIKAALRNAAQHTQELFGSRYKPLQLQTDNYGRGNLTPLYEAMTKHFTPARVKNAKAKVVEPYFKHLNKTYCQLMANWSGFGMKSRKESQPNTDYLNKIRHTFPTEEGCVTQIDNMMRVERINKQSDYLAKWEAMPVTERMPMTDEEYLYLFGETTGFTNRLEASGFNPTIGGRKLSFDTFDIRFRELRHIDWIVKYDPADLTKVLVVNAEKKAGQIKEVATHRFMLEAMYIQPMALAERTDADAAQLAKVMNFNKGLEATITQRGANNREVLDRFFNERPELDDTLTKMVLCDSTGQHKDQRNKARAKKIEQILPDEDWEIIEDNHRDQY